jgi:hypothetical protein
MAQTVRPDGRARDLVERLRADWIGESWDNVVLDDIRLLSDGDQWPPMIQLDYRISGKPGRWIDTWANDQVLRDDPLEVASGLWLSIVSIHLMDLTEPRPEHTPR